MQQASTQNPFSFRIKPTHEPARTYRNRRRWWWWRRRRRLLFRCWSFRRLDQLDIVRYDPVRRIILQQPGGHTREQARLGATLPDPIPPSLIDFFNLFDHLAFDEGHFIVFRSLTRKREDITSKRGQRWRWKRHVPRNRIERPHICLYCLEPEQEQLVQVRARVRAQVLAVRSSPRAVRPAAGEAGVGVGVALENRIN